MKCPNCGRETDAQACPYCSAETPLSAVPLRDPADLPELGPEALEPAAVQSEVIPAEGHENPAAPESPPKTNACRPLCSSFNPYQPANRQPEPYRPVIRPEDAYRPVNVQAAYQPSPPQQKPRSGRETLRKSALSATFLTAIIAFTGSTFFTLLDGIRSLGASAGVYTWSSRLISFSGIVISVLTTIGLWITYAAARDREKKQMTTAGLMMIKVAMVIQFTGTCVLILVAAIAAFSKSYSSVDSFFNAASLSRARSYNFLVISIVLGILVLGIFYYVKVIRMLNSARETILSGYPDDSASGFVAVLNFILAGSLTLVLTSELSEQQALTLLSYLCQALSLIAFGILIFEYRTAMRNARGRKVL